MELALENGAYAPLPGGGLKTVEGEEELCQRLLMKLTARRGGFAPMPGYGSRLYLLLGAVKPSDRPGAARQYAAEALSDEPGVTVEAARVSDNGDGTAAVALELRCGAEALRLDMTV